MVSPNLQAMLTVVVEVELGRGSGKKPSTFQRKCSPGESLGRGGGLGQLRLEN